MIQKVIVFRFVKFLFQVQDAYLVNPHKQHNLCCSLSIFFPNFVKHGFHYSLRDNVNVFILQSKVKQHQHTYTHRRRAGMTRVLMSGRKDERLFLCPWTPPFSLCSAASVFCTLKHTVTSTTAQSFFSAARGKKGFLTKATSLSEEVMQRLKSLCRWSENNENKLQIQRQI